MKLFLSFLIFLPAFTGYSQDDPNNQSSEKIALVVGVSNYQNTDPLKNTLNDASDFSKAMEELGFTVYRLFDPSLDRLKRSVDSFRTKMQHAAVCLFFFSGHGAEFDGENYLFPTDANPQGPEALAEETYPLTTLLKKMEMAKTGIVIIDACRTNPFTKSWGKKSLFGDELANILFPSGIFIGFASSPGMYANAGNGRNGIYTEAILRYIRTPNMSLDQIFNLVNSYVRAKSKGKQIPCKTSSMDDDFYFKRSLP